MSGKTEHTQPPTAVATATTEHIELESPIERAGKTITQVAIRKPMAGAFRGVALMDVMQMDVAALTKLLPRITEPALTEAEIRTMDPADIVQMGIAVTGFLLTRSAKAE
ncbi:MAG: phage tail assembly protein [Porticoccaceae bacterium]